MLCLVLCSQSANDTYLNKKLINDIIFILLCTWVERVYYINYMKILDFIHIDTRSSKPFDLNFIDDYLLT